MNGFRVWSIKEKKMYYEGFYINADGELFREIEAIEDIDNVLHVKMVGVMPDEYIVMKQLIQQDIAGNDLYEKDILLYASGWEFCLEYGIHDAFCPGDRMSGPNEGYVAAIYDANSGTNINECYPLMNVEVIAKCIGNTLQGYRYKYGRFKYLPYDDQNSKDYVMRAVFNDDSIMSPQSLYDLQIKVDGFWEDAYSSIDNIILKGRGDFIYGYKYWPNLEIRIKRY